MYKDHHRWAFPETGCAHSEHSNPSDRMVGSLPPNTPKAQVDAFIVERAARLNIDLNDVVVSQDMTSGAITAATGLSSPVKAGTRA